MCVYKVEMRFSRPLSAPPCSISEQMRLPRSGPPNPRFRFFPTTSLPLYPFLSAFASLSLRNVIAEHPPPIILPDVHTYSSFLVGPAPFSSPSSRFCFLFPIDQAFFLLLPPLLLFAYSFRLPTRSHIWIDGLRMDFQSDFNLT